MHWKSQNGNGIDVHVEIETGKVYASYLDSFRRVYEYHEIGYLSKDQGTAVFLPTPPFTADHHVIRRLSKGKMKIVFLPGAIFSYDPGHIDFAGAVVVRIPIATTVAFTKPLRVKGIDVRQ